jgi:hypothetical protein
MTLTMESPALAGFTLDHVVRSLVALTLLVAGVVAAGLTVVAFALILPVALLAAMLRPSQHDAEARPGWRAVAA